MATIRKKPRTTNKINNRDQTQPKPKVTETIIVQDRQIQYTSARHNPTKQRAQLSQGSSVHQRTGLVVSDCFDYDLLDEEFRSKTCVDLSKKDHDYYFGSYSHFYIHEEMLKDTVRTRAY